MFIIGGQSLFDYDIDSDESSEQGIKSKVQNITFTMSLVERIGLLNTSILQVHYTKQLDPRSLFRSSIMQATLSAMKMFTSQQCLSNNLSLVNKSEVLNL